MAYITHQSQPERLPFIRPLLGIAGYAFFGLGSLGLFIPGLPTTIFWILATYCFAKSKPEMAARILRFPKVGPAIRDFVDHGIIRKPGKIASTLGMGFAGILILLAPMGGLATTASLAMLGIGVVFVLTRKSALPG